METSASNEAVFSQKSVGTAVLRKKSSKHKVGWQDTFLTDSLFASWIQFDSRASLTTCSFCQKHPQHTAMLVWMHTPFVAMLSFDIPNQLEQETKTNWW
jgi:hypothetical protein